MIRLSCWCGLLFVVLVSNAWAKEGKVDSTKNPTPVEERIVALVFGEGAARFFYESTFAEAHRRMGVEYSHETELIEGGKNLIISTAMGFFRDERFVEYYAKVLRDAYAEDDLNEMERLYREPGGELLSRVIVQFAMSHSEFPKEAAGEHFGDLGWVLIDLLDKYRGKED